MTQTSIGAAPAAPATWTERLRGLESAAAAAEALLSIAGDLAALGNAPMPPINIDLTLTLGLSGDKAWRNAELRSAVDILARVFGLAAVTDTDKNHPTHSTPYATLCGVRVTGFLNKKDHELGRVNFSGGRYQVMCSCGEWASGWHGTEGLAREDHDRHARGVDRVEIGIDKCGCIVTAEVNIEADGQHADDWNDNTDRVEHSGVCAFADVKTAADQPVAPVIQQAAATQIEVLPNACPRCYGQNCFHRERFLTPDEIAEQDAQLAALDSRNAGA